MSENQPLLRCGLIWDGFLLLCHAQLMTVADSDDERLDYSLVILYMR
jgi:hypothetical protein